MLEEDGTPQIKPLHGDNTLFGVLALGGPGGPWGVLPLGGPWGSPGALGDPGPNHYMETCFGHIV